MFHADVIPSLFYFFINEVQYNKKMSSFWKNKRIVVTGGAGFLGSHVVDQLKSVGVDKSHIFIPRSSTCDLRDLDQVKKYLKGKDIVIHLAGNVGGIGYNQAHPGTLFYDNLTMGVNLIHAAKEVNLDKLAIIGTVCSYPKFTPVPFKETDLYSGYPEETNAPYGIAKKSLLTMAQAYQDEFGLKSIYLIPVNLYGPGDHFDPKVSHVIPALIKKFLDAKKQHKKQVVVWGTGAATREFLYVEDAAKGIVAAVARLDQLTPVNLGSSHEISIKDLTKLIKKLTGFKGRIVWDKTKPDGQPRRKLNISKADKLFGFRAQTDFVTGLQKTIDWYQQHEQK